MPARRPASKWSTLQTQRDHPEVRAYVAALDPPAQRLARELREIVRDVAPDVREAIYYGCPFFFLEGPLAYVSAGPDHVLLGFSDGTRIRDASGLLQGTGKSPVRRAVFTYDAVIPEATVRGWIRQAASFHA